MSKEIDELSEYIACTGTYTSAQLVIHIGEILQILDVDCCQYIDEKRYEALVRYLSNKCKLGPDTDIADKVIQIFSLKYSDEFIAKNELQKAVYNYLETRKKGLGKTQSKKMMTTLLNNLDGMLPVA